MYFVFKLNAIEKINGTCLILVNTEFNLKTIDNNTYFAFNKFLKFYKDYWRGLFKLLLKRRKM